MIGFRHCRRLEGGPCPAQLTSGYLAGPGTFAIPAGQTPSPSPPQFLTARAGSCLVPRRDRGGGEHLRGARGAVRLTHAASPVCPRRTEAWRAWVSGMGGDPRSRRMELLRGLAPRRPRGLGPASVSQRLASRTRGDPGGIPGRVGLRRRGPAAEPGGAQMGTALRRGRAQVDAEPPPPPTRCRARPESRAQQTIQHPKVMVQERPDHSSLVNSGGKP